MLHGSRPCARPPWPREEIRGVVIPRTRYPHASAGASLNLTERQSTSDTVSAAGPDGVHWPSLRHAAGRRRAEGSAAPASTRPPPSARPVLLQAALVLAMLPFLKLVQLSHNVLQGAMVLLLTAAASSSSHPGPPAAAASSPTPAIFVAFHPKSAAVLSVVLAVSTVAALCFTHGSYPLVHKHLLRLVTVCFIAAYVELSLNVLIPRRFKKLGRLAHVVSSGSVHLAALDALRQLAAALHTTAPTWPGSVLFFAAFACAALYYSSYARLVLLPSG